MSLSVTQSAGTGADSATGTGTITWVNPGNITASDDVRSTASLTTGSKSHRLLASNFGFAIPQGSSIDGVLVEWEISQDNSGGGNAVVSDALLYISGSLGNTNKGDASSFATSDTYKSFGGSLDTWGASLTVDIVNASNFGAALSASEITGANPTVARCDHCRITVYYTPLPPKPVFESGSISQSVHRIWDHFPGFQAWGGIGYEQSYFRRRVVQSAIAPPPVTMTLSTTVTVSINPVPTMDLNTTVTVTVAEYSTEVFFQLTTTVVVLTGVSLNLAGEMASARYRR